MGTIEAVAGGLLAVQLAGGCIRPAEERATLDLEVGRGEVDGIELVVAEGAAAIRGLSPEESILWAQAPTLSITVERAEAGPLRLSILNCMPDAVLRAGESTLEASARPASTHCVFDVDMAAGTTSLVLAPPDAEALGPYRIAVMSDIQSALEDVHEIFEVISETRGVRFVLSTGDITQRAEVREYALFQQQLASLSVPFFSTIGNHELTRDPERWHDLFGLFSVHFSFKGATFSFVDSGNASLDPLLHDRLDGWLRDAEDRVHLFGTHYPLLDPVGMRDGAFRSRNEAAMLLRKLARGRVDLTLYGHIHSYYSFENAGIPAHISGGGGALPERLDGIDRHFLVIDLAPQRGEVRSVSVSRVD